MGPRTSLDNYLPAVSGSKDKSRDKKIKFDNSIIRDKERKSVTVRDIPCEDKIRKLENSGKEKKEERNSVAVGDTPCEDKNSKIRKFGTRR